MLLGFRSWIPLHMLKWQRTCTRPIRVYRLPDESNWKRTSHLKQASYSLQKWASLARGSDAGKSIPGSDARKKNIRGSDAASQEACQARRQRFSVLRLERRARSTVYEERDPVQSPSGQALRDDNLRWLCSSLVGANGRSPEGGLGWNLCLLREKWDKRRIVSPYFLSHLIFSLIFSWAKRTSPMCSFSVFTAFSCSLLLSVERFKRSRSVPFSQSQL